MAEEFKVTDEQLLGALRAVAAGSPMSPPWMIRADAENHDLVVVFGAHFGEIARVSIPLWDEWSIKLQIANAHLIRAAPELLDALRSLVGAAEEAGWDIGANSAVLDRARDALAAAERAS